MRRFVLVAAVLAVATGASSAHAFLGQPMMAETFITVVGTVTETACPTTVETEEGFPYRRVTTSRCALGEVELGCVREHESFTSNSEDHDECTLAVGQQSMTCRHDRSRGQFHWTYDDRCEAAGGEICRESYHQDVAPYAPQYQECHAGPVSEQCVTEPTDPYYAGGSTVTCTFPAGDRECTVVLTQQDGQFTGVDLTRTRCRRA